MKIDLKKIFTFLSGIFLVVGYVVGKLNGFQDIFYYICIAFGGTYVAIDAFKVIFERHFLDINFLALIAAVGAIFISQLPEAGAVVFLLSLAKVFEEYGIEKSRKAVESLVRKSPKEATLLDGTKKKIEDINVKDKIIVKPGDMIPLDGIITKGQSSVDEATITGESIPRDKKEKDSVFQGTMNINGYLEIEVSKKSTDTIYSKIIKLIEQAQKSRAPMQEFVDVFAKYYTPIIVICAFLLAVIPSLFFKEAFSPFLYRSLVLLVIACPCALVLSTPVSVASAIGSASKKGLLVKGGKYLEFLAKVKAIAFDKTKTLTYGKPYVEEVITFNDFSEKEVLADAAGIEKFSSHPISKSILDYAEKKKITPHLMKEFENISGKGSHAVCLVCENLKHLIGNLKLFKSSIDISKAHLEKIENLEKNGKTVILVGEGDKLTGAISISDKIRDEAAQAVNDLKNMKIESIVLTGDNYHAANFVAQKLNIKKVFASLLPDEKVNKINELKQEYKIISMVGDGINDAPSLATASIGIAMGVQGSDVAIETADVVLMNNNLLNIVNVIKLGKKTIKTIKQNIFASLLIKFIFFLLAVIGYMELEYAVMADSGIALMVILNSLRLFK